MDSKTSSLTVPMYRRCVAFVKYYHAVKGMSNQSKGIQLHEAYRRTIAAPDHRSRSAVSCTRVDRCSLGGLFRYGDEQSAVSGGPADGAVHPVAWHRGHVTCSHRAVPCEAVKSVNQEDECEEESFHGRADHWLDQASRSGMAISLTRQHVFQSSELLRPAGQVPRMPSA